MKAHLFERLKSLSVKPEMLFGLILAVSLQIQITILESPTYLGLRINLADIFLPFMMLFLIVSLFLGKSHWPQWRLRNAYFWLGGLFFILTVALINGYFVNGYWSGWALVNKYAGFIILCGYFFLGGWVVQNAKIPEKTIAHVMDWFCAFFVLVVALSAVLVTLQGFVPFPLWLSDFAWDGFMANRNAYMIVCVFVMVYLMATQVDFSYSPKLWLHHLFWFLLPLFCLYNASRTGWIAFSVLFCVYVLRNFIPKMKVILPIFILGSIFAVFSFYTSAVPMVEKTRQFSILLLGLNAPETEQMYIGDKQRLIAVEDGLELYAQSNPIIGAGLGTYKPFQIEKRGAFVNLIDFTALWLLVETGFLGVSGFLVFFVMCILCLYQLGYREGSRFHKAMFVYLIVFAAMTLMHELMYTRFLWFFLGMALCAVSIGKNAMVVTRNVL